MISGGLIKLLREKHQGDFTFILLLLITSEKICYFRFIQFYTIKITVIALLFLVSRTVSSRFTQSKTVKETLEVQ